MNREQIVIALIVELGATMRSRSEAEFLYTAAAVAGFGAVAWGVAALRHEDFVSRAALLRPGAIATMGILLLTVVIILKIVRDHDAYARARAEQARLARILAEMVSPDDLVPARMLNPAVGSGFLYSILVVIAAAIGASAFCLSLN